MRIISGIYKRRRFEIPKTFKARPTTDFAKENLFNVLSNLIDLQNHISALDLFAGTGSISIELISRGCDKVVSVEKEPQHYKFIKQIMQEIKTNNWFPLKADAFKFIDKCTQQFDLVFADPPYQLQQLETIPSLIFERKLLKEGGILILEHGKNNNFTTNSHFIDHRSYGSVNFSFFSEQRGQNPND